MTEKQMERIGQLVAQGYQTVRGVTGGMLMRADDGQQAIVTPTGSLTTSASPWWPQELR